MRDDGLVTGTLTVAATPIGNVGDASDRLRLALTGAELIAAEDTRRLRRLAADLGLDVTARIVSLFEGNERERTEALIEKLGSGEDVLLVSDAGMPTISDPGYRLVGACVDAGISVTALPGPSAVPTALAVSGLPTDRFVFDGFLPRKGGQRQKQLAEYRSVGRTVVLFESPRRLAATLQDLADVLGPDCRAAVCRELTKTHEEIRRGTLAELSEWAASGVLGEVVLVIDPSTQAATGGETDDWPAEVAALVEQGLSRRDAVDQVAVRHEVSRRVVYKKVLDSDS